MQVKDKNGDEKDGYDEGEFSGIIPCDWSTRCDVDIIIDDDLRRCLVEPLLGGVTLTALFDRDDTWYAIVSYSDFISHGLSDLDQETNPQEIGGTPSKIANGAVTIRSFYTPVRANVVCWSACADAQEAYEGKLGRSVMTQAFTKHMQSPREPSLLAVGKAIYDYVERAERLGPQEPQLWVSAVM
ncbi:hypothetical protein FRC08_017287, partial [Ceratobasidium sp. 394]